MTPTEADAQDVRHVVALSGGKDSTALALRLAEVEPREYVYLCTPTGDELPEMIAHWDQLECLLGQPIVRLTNRDLRFWIEDEFKALPNWRQRWCTRLMKIEPFLAWMAANQPCVAYVGLRADEEERRGILSNDVECRFPLREWGWGLAEVKGYLREKGVKIPTRTDCARCYGQRLAEWFNLWRRYPDIYADAERQEGVTGHTFRSPGRDSAPHRLADLRVEFERGFVPRGATYTPLFPDADEEGPEACRVCRL